MIHRRRLLQAASAALFAAPRARSAPTPALGQGDFRYRVVPGWGELGAGTPIKNGHGLVQDKEGHILFLTDHVANNVIVYDKAGRLVHKWGTRFPGAHGLSILTEGAREVLYITDLATHQVVKTTLSGEVLQEWGWPKESGKYSSESEYKPSWTLHPPGGGFLVLDGYGKDYITRYDAEGRYQGVFGGPEGGIVHWGPHGGMMEPAAGQPSLLVAMSDQQYLLRLAPDGTSLGRIPLPGGNPRQIRSFGGKYYVAHLGDNWPANRNCRGFVSVLDEKFRVLSNVAGTEPEYDDQGNLRKMAARGEVFQHPHDLTVDADGSLYVAQFASGGTPPVKLERI